MESINIGNKHCIFLNHQKIIRDIYQHNAEPNSLTYSLKQEIFFFKPRSSPPSVATSNSKQIKNVKRKRKAETEHNKNDEEGIDLQPFISEIQQRLLDLPQQDASLTRSWEEQYDFPQFHGANLTEKYQITSFCQRDYIVPPKTKFYNHNIENLTKLLPELEKYDLLVMDMPWKNKYIKRLKKVKTSLAYQMLDNEILKNMPIPELLHENSLVALWCTNASQHRQAVEQEFLPKWNLHLVHTIKWFKINTMGDLISPLRPEGYKQPYEILYIACHKQRDLSDLHEIVKLDFLISIPSIIHSHKPPLGEWLKQFLPDPQNFKGLELFARYLQPKFTSIGLEVLKLMDKRLYDLEKN